MSKELIKCSNLSKIYKDGDHETSVLHGVNLSVKEGELLAIVGSSGSGKSTLLHILGSLDSPSSGEILFKGKNIDKMNSSMQAKLRNQSIGFIYQFHHLLSEFDSLENVAMPLLIAGEKVAIAKEKALNMLGKVGLAHRASHRPSELSGGERQRVAIARALINSPELVLADEPTGNLDQKSALSVYNLIRELSLELGTAFIVVTHDLELANKLDRQEQMINGKLQGGL